MSSDGMPGFFDRARDCRVLFHGCPANEPRSFNPVPIQNFEEPPGSATASVLALTNIERVWLAIGKRASSLFRLVVYADKNRKPHSVWPRNGLLRMLFLPHEKLLRILSPLNGQA